MAKKDELALADKNAGDAKVQAAAIPGIEALKAGPDAKPASVRKIITTSQVQLISDNFNEDVAKVELLISSLKLSETGGYLSQHEISGSAGDQRYGLWAVRLSLDQVDGFLKDVVAVAELVKSDSKSNDVTDQYVDLSARVKNKLQEENRLLSHLEKSASLPDTLLLEKELSRVREEVERLQGQLNVLTAATDLATIHIRLLERSRYQPPVVATAIPFVTKIGQTFMKSYQELIGFLQGCAIILAGLAPWFMAAFIVAAPWLLISRLIRSRNRSRTV
ncbi:MAG: hypothetical protein JWM11_6719 [Planctomycetaceae bacterium]|nr:hypothetical protein [Planctomycetaceae bacterium]